MRLKDELAVYGLMGTTDEHADNSKSQHEYRNMRKMKCLKFSQKWVNFSNSLISPPKDVNHLLYTLYAFPGSMRERAGPASLHAFEPPSLNRFVSSKSKAPRSPSSFCLYLLSHLLPQYHFSFSLSISLTLDYKV